MASFASALGSCTRCATRLHRTGLEVRARALGSHVQTRGKKKNAPAKSTLPVRLLQNLPGYGRKGSIVPMTKGPMRNIYFPRGIADYVTLPEQKELKRNGVIPERDFNFGRQTASEGAEIKEEKTRLFNPFARATAQPKPVRVTLDKMQPSEAFKSLDALLPPAITFYRMPIPQSQPPTTNFEQTTQLEIIPIYGSVSTNDVATSIKALMASSEIAGRVVIGEGDIRFADAETEETRVKQLGDFAVEIKIKGHSQTIRRLVQVLAEDDAPVDIEKGERAVRELAGENPIKGEADPDVLVLEARASELEERVEGLSVDASDILSQGRINTPDRQLTPAEEAEIEARGDMVPRELEDEPQAGKEARRRREEVKDVS